MRTFSESWRNRSRTVRQHKLPSHRPPTANTVLIVDSSYSMNGPLAGPGGRSIRKRDAAVEAAILLARHKALTCPQDLLGCVAFGSRGWVVSPLTRPSDPKLVHRLQGLRVNGSTNMVEGLRLGFGLLRARPSQFLRNAVLLSDGAPDSRHGLDDLVRSARLSRINLHCVGVGDAGDLDEALLRRLAGITWGGRYQHVRSLDQLARALQAIS